MTPQVRGAFPLADALSLAEALGYSPHAMAELLSAAAAGVTQALIEQKDSQRG
jgi:hypothetical protein